MNNSKSTKWKSPIVEDETWPFSPLSKRIESSFFPRRKKTRIKVIARVFLLERNIQFFSTEETTTFHLQIAI